MSTASGPRRKTKAFHHKSRGGCRTCKTRRVKCDEKRPRCNNCIRIGSEVCIYDAVKPTSSSKMALSGRSLSSPSDSHHSATDLARFNPASTPSPVSLGNMYHSIDSIDLPESASRRKLEMRLLHNFMTHLTNPYAEKSTPAAVLGWLQEVPKLSLEFDNLQYMMLACSGAHLLRSLPDNGEVANAHQVYITLALRDQQRAVANMNHVNSESIVYSALLHFLYSFSCLWNRPLDPYTPPTDWLHVGKGVRSVLVAVLEGSVQRNAPDPNNPNHKPSSAVLMVRNAPPDFRNDNLYSKENILPLPVLLDYTVDAPDYTAREAYEDALGYIGSMYEAVYINEPVFSLTRRFMGFSIFVPNLFIQLVKEQRPRALVILAMYFALMSRAQSVWWVGDIPHREILAIQRVLPPEWQEAMQWPLAVAGLITSYC
ncbi:hypothetical protein BGW36DRAFT_372292 [Talaromyces proteolyticus]|uniref:Zn(2)-C6 fungal-type domain-containing protein n=1 Tax=Talaromyces proteolyticus TaxID=1131652 RepID=A0AAD4Q3Y5_9EURO|nr:uncharacterized protein BGW36DRAFT_372292 [Talaromyces proteolyticus]KAH8702142.1 hypothetical protein BGW36DRAFT_372292 [Talaromyces proteolyticus]